MDVLSRTTGVLPFVQIATSGDLAAAPVPSVTFGGLGGYTDLEFVLTNVSTDYTSANQAIGIAISTDGTTFTAASSISATASAANAIQAQVVIIDNQSLRVGIQALASVSGLPPARPSIVTATSSPKIVFVDSPIVAVRFAPLTSGNFDNGSIVAKGR